MRAPNQRRAILGEGQSLPFRDPPLQPRRQLVGKALEILQHRPAHLVAIESAPELGHGGELALIGFDRGIVLTREDRDAGAGDALEPDLERRAGRLIRFGPARHVETYEALRTVLRRHAGSTIKPGMARIAARLERDMNGSEPQILERA